MDWATSDRPDDMLDAARGLIADRQLLLYAVGCCGLAEYRVPNIGPVAAMLEQAAKGKVRGREGRRGLLEGITGAFGGNLFSWLGLTISQSEAGCWLLARQASSILRVAGRGAEGPWVTGTDREQADLLREIVGDPFQSVVLPQSWRTDSVVRIAEMLEETRDWEMMPVLADALEDAGCDDGRVLTHCRGTVHAPGCWVLDALLKRNETPAVSEAA